MLSRSKHVFSNYLTRQKTHDIFFYSVLVITSSSLSISSISHKDISCSIYQLHHSCLCHPDYRIFWLHSGIWLVSSCIIYISRQFFFLILEFSEYLKLSTICYYFKGEWFWWGKKRKRKLEGIVFVLEFELRALNEQVYVCGYIENIPMIIRVHSKRTGRHRCCLLVKEIAKNANAAAAS